MELTIRIYTKNDSRTISFNAGEIDEMVEKYLKEQYLGDDEIVESIAYENVGLEQYLGDDEIVESIAYENVGL